MNVGRLTEKVFFQRINSSDFQYHFIKSVGHQGNYIFLIH